MGLAVPSLWILALLGSQVRWKIAAWRASRAKKGTHRWSGELGSQTLCGKVIAVNGGAAEAFVLAIDQQATEYESNWNETSRRLTTRPFTMELPDGKHLRVEPDDSSQLVASLDPPVKLGEGVRRRQVRLALGDEVCVVGRIGHGALPTGGYRGESKGLVMSPPPGGRMLLSTEALEQLFARRARSARNWLIVWLFCLFLPCWGAYLPFWVNATLGGAGTATVVAKSTIVVHRDKESDYQTDVVTLRIDATGQQFRDRGHPSVGLGPGARVPVFYARSWAAYAQLGGTPTVDMSDDTGDLGFFGAFLPDGIMVVLGLVRYIRPRPWWERPRLNEAAGQEGLTSRTAGRCRLPLLGRCLRRCQVFGVHGWGSPRRDSL